MAVKCNVQYKIFEKTEPANVAKESVILVIVIQGSFILFCFVSFSLRTFAA